jgi:hypothetical protein
MTRVLARRQVSTALVAIGVALIVGCWVLLQLSRCAGDLKQATGDIETALTFEGRPLVASALGMLALTSAFSIGATRVPSWIRLIACVLSFPVACAVFLVLALLSGHASWVCAL